MAWLIRWYRLRRRRKLLAAHRANLEIDPAALLVNGFDVQFRQAVGGRTFLRIGADSLIGATFVFERDSGGITVGSRCHLGGGTTLISIDGIEIGDDVTIAWGVTVYDHDSHPLAWEDRRLDTTREAAAYRACGNELIGKDWTSVRHSPVRIRDKAWIGMGAIVLKGVTIGEGAVVGAGSVVTRDVPPWTVAAGNPARVVKTLQPVKPRAARSSRNKAR